MRKNNVHFRIKESGTAIITATALPGPALFSLCLQETPPTLNFFGRWWRTKLTRPGALGRLGVLWADRRTHRQTDLLLQPDGACECLCNAVLQFKK